MRPVILSGETAATAPPAMGADESFPTHRRELLLVLVLFCLSRLGYWALGVRFSTFPLHWYWQVVDPQLLVTRPIESLTHLHSQPPLFNAYLAAVLQLPEALRTLAFWGSFLLLGVAIACGLLALLRELGVSQPVRVVTTVLLVASPAAVLYENKLFYTYPVLAALVWAALLLQRFLVRGRTAALVGFSALLVGIVLTRSLFHLGYLVAVCAWLPLVAGPQRRRAALCGGVAILVAGSWYVHCGIRFGNFGASSWFGMNIANTVLRTATAEERAELATASPRSRILGHLPFLRLSEYESIVALPAPTGVAILDQLEKRPGLPNFHHLGYIAVSNRFRDATVWAILHRPHLYLRGLGTSWRLYFRSAADDELLEPNALAVEPVERWYRLVLGQRHRMTVRNQIGPREFAWLLAAATAAAFALGLRQIRRDGWRSPRGATVGFMLATLLYVALVGNFLDLGENNRFGLLVQPFLFCLLALSAERAPATPP